MNLYDWKNHEITQVIFKELKSRQEHLRDELSQTAGVDPLMDRWKCGVIAAYEDILSIELDEEAHD